MMRRTLALGIGFWLTTTFVMAEGVETTVQRIQVGDKGSIELSVPKSWRMEVHQSASYGPPTIVFWPKPGPNFQIAVTPAFSTQQHPLITASTNIKRTVQAAAEEISTKSVEATLELREIVGAQGSGWYFLATDRAPKPGEFRYLTEGMLRVGDLAPIFSILTNDGEDEIVAQALAMLRKSKHFTIQ